MVPERISWRNDCYFWTLENCFFQFLTEGSHASRCGKRTRLIKSKICHQPRHRHRNAWKLFSSEASQVPEGGHRLKLLFYTTKHLCQSNPENRLVCTIFLFSGLTQLTGPEAKLIGVMSYLTLDLTFLKFLFQFIKGLRS